MKFFVLLILVLPLVSFATVPAEQMPLTKQAIENLGFRVEVMRSSSNITVTLFAPPEIAPNWRLVATQTYSYKGDKVSFLSKVGITNPGKETDIYVSYDAKVSDAFIGAYYICVGTVDLKCPFFGAERLYFIESLNQHLQ